MTHKSPSVRHLLVTLMVLIGFFAANVSVANAQLASIISSGIGAATSAAISCNKNAISKGISSIFGGGSTGSGGGGLSGTTAANLAGFGKANATPTGGFSTTADGPLDIIGPKTLPTNITPTNPTAITDPTAFPGLDLGSSPTVAAANTPGVPGFPGGPTMTGGQMDSSASPLANIFGLSGASAVPVTNNTLEANSKKIAASTAATTKKLTCTNAIEKAAAQTILKQLTTSTVNWINHGFQGGGPLFLGDPTAFFKSIQDSIVKQFSSVIGLDPKNYPFGANAVKQLTSQLTSTFEQGSKYSLNEVVAQQVPGATGASFMKDFATGGWDAFLGMTSSNNNPYGFNLSAQSELSKRIASTAYSPAQDVKDQLQRNGGILDLKKCVSPANYNPSTAASTPCAKWQTQTPGSAISSQLNQALGAPTNQLISGQDLNASLTAVFDALVNQLISKGLSSLSTTPASAAPTNSPNQSYAPNVLVNDASGATSTDFLNSGDALQTNIFSLDPSGFDLSDPNGKRVNLVSLIDRERLMISSSEDDADELAKALGWTPAQEATWVTTITSTDPNYRNILGRQVNLTERLIPLDLELDYCIPGPHPTWQSDTATNLQNFLADNDELPQSTATLPSWTTKLPLIGSIFSTINSLNADKKNESVYSDIIGHWLGVSVDADVKVNGYNSAANIFGTLYSRYAAAVAGTYTPGILAQAGYSPVLTADDATEFNNLPAYEDAISGNFETITETIETIAELEALGKKINALETNTPALAGYPSPVRGQTFAVPVTYDDYQAQLAAITASSTPTSLTEYGRALKSINDTFNLIAPNLLSSEDIANEKSALDAIGNKLEAVGGPGGDIEECEAAAAAQTSGPAGRMLFPASVAAYLPADFAAQFKATSSFLPDFSYAQGQTTSTSGGLIQNDDVVTIDRQPAASPTSVAALETPTAASMLTAYPLTGMDNLVGNY